MLFLPSEDNGRGGVVTDEDKPATKYKKKCPLKLEFGLDCQGKSFSFRSSFLNLGSMEIMIIVASSLGIIGFIICLIMVCIQLNSIQIEKGFLHTIRVALKGKLCEYKFIILLKS